MYQPSSIPKSRVKLSRLHPKFLPVPSYTKYPFKLSKRNLTILRPFLDPSQNIIICLPDHHQFNLILCANIFHLYIPNFWIVAPIYRIYRFKSRCNKLYFIVVLGWSWTFCQWQGILQLTTTSLYNLATDWYLIKQWFVLVWFDQIVKPFGTILNYS